MTRYWTPDAHLQQLLDDIPPGVIRTRLENGLCNLGIETFESLRSAGPARIHAVKNVGMGCVLALWERAVWPDLLTEADLRAAIKGKPP